MRGTVCACLAVSTHTHNPEPTHTHTNPLTPAFPRSPPVRHTDERELYDLRKDPGELYNIYDKAKPAVRSRLEGLLAVLAVCKGESCSNPWKVRPGRACVQGCRRLRVGNSGNYSCMHGHEPIPLLCPRLQILHPDGTVKNFTQALNSKYDRIYNAIRPFTYKTCLQYLVRCAGGLPRVWGAGTRPRPAVDLLTCNAHPRPVLISMPNTHPQDWDNEDSQFKTQIRGANPAAGVGHHRLLTAASERAIATRRRAQAAVSAELAERPAVFQAKVEVRERVEQAGVGLVGSGRQWKKVVWAALGARRGGDVDSTG